MAPEAKKEMFLLWVPFLVLCGLTLFLGFNLSLIGYQGWFLLTASLLTFPIGTYLIWYYGLKSWQAVAVLIVLLGSQLWVLGGIYAITTWFFRGFAP